jgi:hypothetical protein
VQIAWAAGFGAGAGVPLANRLVMIDEAIAHSDHTEERLPIAEFLRIKGELILAGAAMIAGPGLHNGTIDPRGLVWAVPGPVIYAFYLAANARLMRRHPPLIGAGFLCGASRQPISARRCSSGRRCRRARRAGCRSPSWRSDPARSPRCRNPTACRGLSGDYAIIANCELVTVVVVGATALGEKLTSTHALGGGLILTFVTTTKLGYQGWRKN